MSSSTDSTGARAHCRAHDRRSTGTGCRWTGLNIAAMVVGFMVAWPIGLFVLLWIVLGRDVQELPDEVRRQWSRVSDAWRGQGAGSDRAETDNVVFNEYQQAQYERVREIKEEIKSRARRFREFRANAKRRADEEEFDRFMGEAPVRDSR